MGDDHFAQQLKAKRMRASLTQQQLADKMNVSRKTISGWETGRNRPDIDSLKRLAAIYHISLDELVANEQKHGTNKSFRNIRDQRLTNSILVVILAVIAAERVTQSSPDIGFWLMDGLFFWIIGLRILTSRFGLKRPDAVTSPIFLVGYSLFVIVAISIAIIYPFHIGFGFQYGIGFSGYLGLSNLGLILWHRFKP